MDFLQVSGVASVLVFGASLLLALRVLALAGEHSVGEEVLRHTAYILLAAGSLVACLLVAGPGALFIWPIVMTIWARAAINQRFMQKRSLIGGAGHCCRQADATGACGPGVWRRARG